MPASSLPTRSVRLEGDDLPRAASEWMQLEDLSEEITQSNTRLDAARSSGSHAVAQVIEKEVTQLEQRRSQLLANIAQTVIGEQEPNEDRASAEKSHATG